MGVLQGFSFAGKSTVTRTVFAGALLIAALVVVPLQSRASGSPTILEFPIAPGSSARSLVAGSDGALWVLENGLNEIARVTTTGDVTQYPIPTTSSNPGFITEGSDGAVWFSETAGEKIGRLSISGTFSEYSVPQPAPTIYQNPANPSGVTLGPDGAVWFAENGGHAIGRVSVTGQVSAFATQEQPSFPGAVTAGPQSNIWYTEGASNPQAAWKIGEMTSGGTVVHEFPVSGPVYSIAPGSDGNLWFADPNNNSIDRMDPSGNVTAFTVPTANAGVNRLTLGPDGNVWFTETAADNVGMITKTGAITEYPLPTPGAGPAAIAAGPNGTVWFTERAVDKVGCIDTAVGTCVAAATTTTSAPATPVVSLTSGSLALHGAQLALGLACHGAPCSGSAQFSAMISIVSGRGANAKHKIVSTVLATGRFALAAGARASVSLALTVAGRSAFARARAHRILGTVIVIVGRGATLRRSMVAQ